MALSTGALVIPRPWNVILTNINTRLNARLDVKYSHTTCLDVTRQAVTTLLAMTPQKAQNVSICDATDSHTSRLAVLDDMLQTETIAVYYGIL